MLATKPRTRQTPGLTALVARRWGGSLTNPNQYDYNPGSGISPGASSFMADFTGTFRQFSSAHPLMTERPLRVVSIDWRPYVASGYTHYNNVAAPNTGVNSNSGPIMCSIFGNFIKADSNAESAVLWNTIPLVNPVTLNERNVRITNEVWKSVDTSQASSLVSALEAHKSLRLLNSKGRALVALIDAAKRGESAFLKALTNATGKDIRKQPMPRRYLVWDPIKGEPLNNGKGKTFSRYGRYVWVPTDNLSGTAAGLLLEYRYGWKILVMEMVDQLKAFYAEDQRGELMKFRNDYQVARKRETFTDVLTTQVSGIIGGMTFQGTVVNTCTQKVHAWVRWRLKTDPLFRRLNDYGIFDVTRSMYDIIPYSFVLDMFADISGYLQAVDAYLKADVLSSGHSIDYSHAVVRTATSSNASSFGWTPDVPYGSKDVLNVRNYFRKPYLGFPTRPTVQVKLGLYNIATLAALLKVGADRARTLRV